MAIAMAMAIALVRARVPARLIELSVITEATSSVTLSDVLLAAKYGRSLSLHSTDVVTPLSASDAT